MDALWQNAVQKHTPAATYTYVPLEAYLETRPYVVTLAGCRRYLLVKSTSSGLEFSTVLYVYDEPKAGAPSQFKLESLPYFTNFTGVTLVKDLASGEQSRFDYIKGVRQSGTKGQKGTSSQAGTSGSKTTACSTTYVCEWTGYCEGSSVTWQVYTSGTDYCREPDSGGICYMFLNWQQTGAWAHTYCDSGSGDDGGCPSCNGGCSSCGDSDNGPTPPTNLNSPCGKMYTLGNQSYIKQASSNLLGLMGQNGEFGYAYRNNGLNGTDYEFRQSANFNNPANSSEDDRRSIRWNQLQWPLDGLMHTHPPGSFTIFSMSDLQAMYLLKRNNQMADPATFTNFVFTASGDDYALKITNLNDFIEFGGTIANQDDLIEFELIWLNNQPGSYNISESNSRAANEQAFLRLLKERKTGLTMFKHERTSDTWQQRDVNANKMPIDVPCQ